MESKNSYNETDEQRLQQLMEQLSIKNLKKDITAHVLSELEKPSKQLFTKGEKKFLAITGFVSIILLSILFIEIIRYKDVATDSLRNSWIILIGMVIILLITGLFFLKKLLRIRDNGKNRL